MSILSTDSRALMADSLESLLISSGGRLRGCVSVSAFFFREEDLPRSDEALEKCRELLERCFASPEGLVGVAGEAGRADLLVGDDDADLDGDFVGEDDSE